MVDDRSRPRVLILGAAGYLGSHLLAYLQAHGVCVRGVDRVVSGSCVQLDLRDGRELAALVADFEPDTLVHAATASALAYQQDESSCFEADRRIFDAVLAAIEPKTRLVQFSSSYVANGLPLTSTPLAESAAFEPSHPFGRAKLFFEDHALRSHENTVNFRLCSLFGGRPGPHPNAVTQMIAQARAEGRVQVWGRGVRAMQYIWLDDALRVLARVGELPRGTYHLGGDDRVSVAQAARDIARALGAQLVFDETRKEGETLAFLDNTKLKTALETEDLFTPWKFALQRALASSQSPEGRP